MKLFYNYSETTEAIIIILEANNTELNFTSNHKLLHNINL